MPRAVRRPYGPRATDESRRGTGTAPQSKKSRGRCATAEPRRGSSRQTFDRCGSASYKSGPPDEGGSRARLENLRCETSRALCVAVQSGRLPCGQVTGGSWQSTHSRGAPSILAFSNASRRNPDERTTSIRPSDWRPRPTTRAYSACRPGRQRDACWPRKYAFSERAGAAASWPPITPLAPRPPGACGRNHMYSDGDCWRQEWPVEGPPEWDPCTRIWLLSFFRRGSHNPPHARARTTPNPYWSPPAYFPSLDLLLSMVTRGNGTPRGV